MVRLGILSDTHLSCSEDVVALTDALLAGPFADVSAILHAGDMVSPFMIDSFAPVPCYAVQGNMDQATSGVPQKRILGFEGHRIGLVHGWGPRAGLEKRVVEAFADERIDCLVYGHSHSPVCHRQDGLLIFNPGSPVDRRSAPSHTVGILEVSSVGIQGEIIHLD
ncbi:MAG: YfcE family phosphodiesterase [Desulfuromonas sp.]|nr:MAG: YfcE family phosphodiesterase [Desulfuromonas sp.]